MHHSEPLTLPLENLTFWQGETPSVRIQSALVTVVSSSTDSSSTDIIECRISASIRLAQHEQIERDKLFNLIVVRDKSVKDAKEAWQSDRPLQIQLSLRPDLLPHLCDRVPNLKDISNHLQQCNAAALQQGRSTEPLLQQENWCCLSITQIQDTGEVGYETLWKYLDLFALTDPETTGDKVAGDILKFFTGALDRDLATSTEATANIFNNLTQDLKDSFRSSIGIEDDEDISLFNQLLQFFERDDWSFTHLRGENVLHLSHVGENGVWSCYATVWEEGKQIFFYSICPIAAPKDRRTAAMEFVTRANYGMSIGNFEIDLEDGRIRYKTSIDVEGSTSVAALVKQLVRANVDIMDLYLPGIAATIEQGMGAQEAIALVEGGSAATPEPPSTTPSPQTLDLPVLQHSDSDSDSDADSRSQEDKQARPPLDLQSREDDRVRPPMEEPLQFKGFQASFDSGAVEGNSKPASGQEGKATAGKGTWHQASQNVAAREAPGEENKPNNTPNEERRTRVESAVSQFVASQKERQERIAAIGQSARPRLQAVAASARATVAAATDRNRNTILHDIDRARERVRSEAATAKERVIAQHESTAAEIQTSSTSARERLEHQCPIQQRAIADAATTPSDPEVEPARTLQKIHAAEQQTLELAARTLDDRLQSIDAGMHSTLTSLDSMQTVQLQVLETVGKQQGAGIDAKAEQTAAALQERVASTTASIDDTYQAFAGWIREVETPSLEEVRSSIDEATARMVAAEAEIGNALEAGITDSEQKLSQDGQRAIAGLNAIGHQAFARGDSVAGESEASIGQTVRDATTTFDRIRQGHKSAMSALA